jgi:hypothetical protein
MTASRNLRLLLALPLLSLASACQGAAETTDEDPLASTSAALALCPEPSLGVATLCDLGGGQVKFLVTLELGEQYVELFVRQNGIQNVALDITRTAHVHYNGWATYAATLAGYQDGDHLEYRFYSYLPGKPGVFTPGPRENVWLTHDYAADAKLDLAVTKDASLIYSSYGTGPSFNKNFGSAPTVDVAGYHHESRGLFGYDLAALDASMLIKKAELVIPAMWAAGGNIGSFTLSKVDPGASWQEQTVTWMTTPPSTLFGEFTVDASVENRLDITSLVASAVAAGETELSVLLEDIQNNLFIDSREKVAGKPTFLHVEYADVD